MLRPIAYAFLVVMLALALVRCASQAQIDASHAVAAAVVAATDPAGPGGATVTQEEEDHIASLIENVKAAEGLDWEEVVAGAVAALGTVIPALRFLPNRFFLGHKEAAALDKAAGIPT